MLDLLRYHKFANLKANKDKRPVDVVKEYNIKFPELSNKQKLINLSKALKINGLHKAITGKDIPLKKKK